MRAYSAYVGIDWASKKHDIEIEYSDGTRESAVIEHSSEVIRTFFSMVHARAGGLIAVTLELSTGPIVSILKDLDYVELYPVNPRSLARFRQTFYLSGAKNDPTDALLLKELLMKHGERLRSLRPEDEVTQKLSLLTRHRRQFVDNRTAIILQLQDCLKGYFPLFLRLFADLDSGSALCCLQRWPSLEQLQAATDNELRVFFSSLRCRKAKTEERIALIRSEPVFCSDVARNLVSARVVTLLCEQLRTLNESIKSLENELDVLVPTHDDYEIIASLPGTGPIHTARLLAALHGCVERFGSSTGMSNYFGVSPILIRSGNSQIVCARKARPHFLHQTIVEWAAETRKRCKWASELYAKQRARGKSHNIAVRALAYKWMRILFACMASRTPYQEERFLQKVPLPA